MRPVSLHSVLLLILVACGGTAPRPEAPTDDRDVVEMEELRITARRTEDGQLELSSYDAEMLFRRGFELMSSRRCPEAVEHYDRIADEFPSSRYVSPALYNAGLCLQDTGRYEASAERYERLLRERPESADVKHARFQLASVLVELERWERAVEVAESLLADEELTPDERMEAMARRAQGLLGAEELDEAERQARSAVSYYGTRSADDQVRDNFFIAAANFVLAEVLRQRSEAIAIPRADVEEQHRVLEQKAQLLLDAQREYFNVMRHRHAHWAAAAGYRIGAMYDRLWEEIMAAPTPPPDDPLPEGTEGVYEEEYRLELARLVKPLIRHSIRYWELTLMMVERTGVQGEWKERLREDLGRARERLLEAPEGRGGLNPDGAPAEEVPPDGSETP